VDQLYAFFIQWSPNIYGVEDDIDPKERGFVVVDESEENEESMEVVEDHFESNRGRFMRQMTKDWEVSQILHILYVCAPILSLFLTCMVVFIDFSSLCRTAFST
jgi:uncharacterized protein YwqG